MTIEQRRVHDYLGFEEESFKNKAGFFYPVRFLFAQLSRKMTNEARFHNFDGTENMNQCNVLEQAYIPPLTSI